ncbi:autoinducer binding domain-containing protein [Bradyrhizobium sp. NBAIM01]|uniref:autoinducer binding domain-containing protein n=1 Tax=Bradyrhizobium sp. NBAIM01 TaxID=2793818 RepID=UPI003207FD0F
MRAHLRYVQRDGVARERVHAFERIAERLTQKLGFRRFACLRLDGAKPMLISSYPKSWTSRYYQPGYQQLDPVVLRAKVEPDLLVREVQRARVRGGASSVASLIFDEATTFDIRRQGCLIEGNAEPAQVKASALAMTRVERPAAPASTCTSPPRPRPTLDTKPSPLQRASGRARI